MTNEGLAVQVKPLRSDKRGMMNDKYLAFISYHLSVIVCLGNMVGLGAKRILLEILGIFRYRTLKIADRRLVIKLYQAKKAVAVTFSNGYSSVFAHGALLPCQSNLRSFRAISSCRSYTSGGIGLRIWAMTSRTMLMSLISVGWTGFHVVPIRSSYREFSTAWRKRQLVYLFKQRSA
jgi:hypothetical protein